MRWRKQKANPAPLTDHVPWALDEPEATLEPEPELASPEPPAEEPVATLPEGPTVYHGRLYSDGGNLFAQDEPEGQELRHEPGVGYVHVYRDRGDLGHFETFHQRFVTIVRTEDDSHPHHFAPVSGDPNIDEQGNLRFDADHIAAKITGHTDAYEPHHG